MLWNKTSAPLDSFVDASSAAAYMNECIYRSLCACFPVASPSPVKPYISYETCEQITIRKDLRKKFLEEKERYIGKYLRCIFEAWVAIGPIVVW